MKSKEVWIVKMSNNYDETEFDRWMFDSVKEASNFLSEYLPGNNLFSGDIRKLLDKLERDAYEYQYATAEFEDCGLEMFSVGTSKPIAKDYIIS